jgi:catechol 2,3-dioxygenase-like lactoylglutathione lyase family enzyme
MCHLPGILIWDNSGVLDHIAIQVEDLGVSSAFYDTVLAVVGGKRLIEYGEVIGYGDEFPQFWLGPATTGGKPREVHLAFRAPDRSTVVEFYQTALATGAQSLHEPRLWPEYHSAYFGAFVRDPDGNNVEAVCHQPE